MTKWVTIFPKLRKEHINKDVGLIPIVMHKFEGYESLILTVDNIDYLSNEMGCVIAETSRWLGQVKLGITKYILKNAKKIDVINVYHFSLSESLLWIMPYKLLNRKGRVYLKMDLSTKYMMDYTNNKVMLIFRRCFLKYYDLISAESTVVCDYINKYYKNKVKYIPNGYYWEDAVQHNNIRKKELLHVARMGAESKCTEVLINAFEMSLDEHNWCLRLVGSMEPKFKVWFDEKISSNEDLKNRVIYQGSVMDRQELAEIYSESGIFILSSEHESFGIVLIEALSQGCFLLGTDGINSISDIISNTYIGKIAKSNDTSNLKQNILESIKIVENETAGAVDYRRQYAKNNYSWINLCQNINQYLK